MGLLIHNLSQQYSQVADLVYHKQFDIDPKLEFEYNDTQKKRMYEDILHNLSFLEASHRLGDETLFLNYAKWVYQLMANLLKTLGEERVKEQMILHYQILDDALEKTLKAEEYKFVNLVLLKAIEVTKKTNAYERYSNFSEGKYGEIRDTYLKLLLSGDSKNAVLYIKNIASSQLSIEEIYIDVLQEVMIEIGNLWHQQMISVDQEHYMTSITQVVLSQFYSLIFNTPKNGKKLLTCSVGGELHEMGARMLSDLFEYHGWDSIYLGAAIPKMAILKSIETQKPDLVGLSVTMPQHLIECYEMVLAIKEKFPSQRIAVGGRAFQMTDNVWKKWPVNISTNDAMELLTWAAKEFNLK